MLPVGARDALAALGGLMSGTESGVSWDEVWQLGEEMEGRWRLQIEYRVHPARCLTGGKYYPARVGVTITRSLRDPGRQTTRYCELGGKGGARHVAAALHRALSELYWALEEEEGYAAEQATF